MFLREEIKEKSKMQLTGRWGLVGGLYLLLGIINFAMGRIPIISWLAIFILTGPIVFGMYVISFKVSREEEVGMSDAFSGFTNFGRALGMDLWMTLWIFLWTLLLIIPGIIKGYSYSMAFYILIDHPEMSVGEALKESMAITDGHKMDLFIMDLSFIGWGILSILTLGIGFFWLTPYSQTSWANAYDNLKRL